MATIALEGFTAHPVIACDESTVWFSTSSRKPDVCRKGLPIEVFLHSFVDGFGMDFYNEWDQLAFFDALDSWDFTVH